MARGEDDQPNRAQPYPLGFRETEQCRQERPAQIPKTQASHFCPLRKAKNTFDWTVPRVGDYGAFQCAAPKALDRTTGVRCSLLNRSRRRTTPAPDIELGRRVARTQDRRSGTGYREPKVHATRG